MARNTTTAKKKHIPAAIIIIAGLVLGLIVGIIVQHAAIGIVGGLLLGLLVVPVISAMQR